MAPADTFMGCVLYSGVCAPPFSAWRRKEEETLDLARKEVLRLVMFAIFTVDIFKLCVIIQTCIYTDITTYLTV